MRSYFAVFSHKKVIYFNLQVIQILFLGINSILLESNFPPIIIVPGEGKKHLNCPLSSREIFCLGLDSLDIFDEEKYCAWCVNISWPKKLTNTHEKCSKQKQKFFLFPSQIAWLEIIKGHLLAQDEKKRAFPPTKITAAGKQKSVK